MERFNFDNWSCSAEEAMTILNCSKRTIQNYYHPKKRDPIKWKYLELIVTHRILPPDLGILYRDGEFHTNTGYSFKPYELSQWELFQSFKTSEIIELRQEIEQLRSEVKVLKSKNTPQKKASNVIAFPKKHHGDVTA